MKIWFALLGLLLLFEISSAQTDTELAYDDGNPNLEMQLAVDGSYFVVRFSPPAESTQIIQIRLIPLLQSLSH